MSDDPRDPALEVVLGALHDAVLESMFGPMPGTVVSYDATKRTISVQPSLQRGRQNTDDGVREQKPLPIMTDVPV